MTPGESKGIDLSAPVSELANDASTADPQTKVQIENTKLELQSRQCRLELEKERLTRTKENSGRRPWLFRAGLAVVIVLFLGFAIGAAEVIYTFPKVEPHIFITTLFLTAAVPTLLLIALVKVIFSPAPQEDEDKAKLSDVIPFSKAAETIRSAIE